MDEVGVGSILDYAVEEDLEKSDAVEMEMDSCSSGTGSRFWFGVAISVWDQGSVGRDEDEAWTRQGRFQD